MASAMLDEVSRIDHRTSWAQNLAYSFHPTQSLADLVHLKKTFGSLEALRGKKIAMTWAYSPSYGKPLSVPQGIIGLMSRFGMHVSLAYPKGYDLVEEPQQAASRFASQSGGTFDLRGDDSLSLRPMGRIAEPLARMGAEVETTDGRLPLRIRGRPLHGIEYELPVASAQVKSCVLLAGLYAAGETVVREPQPTRDHTELMLQSAGARVAVRPGVVSVAAAERLALGEVAVPGDFSSAAPLVVAATLVPGSELHLHGVNLNPRRTGLLAILERMGAKVTVYNRRSIGGEPAGDLEIRSAPLVGTTVGSREVPVAIDELPLFALAASFARGESRLRGAAELRAKESDRIEATVDALRALGVRARGTSDGFVVTGVPSRLRGGHVDSRGDHRIAMLGAVAGLASGEGVRVDDADCVGVSFPGFFDLVAALRREAA